MTPETEHEEEIAKKVDAKATAIARGQGTWGSNIISEMAIAVGFVMNPEEDEFLKKYVVFSREICSTSRASGTQNTASCRRGYGGRYAL